MRARTLVYATLLLTLVSGFAWSVIHRSMLLAEVIRDRNALFRPGPAGTVENSYTIKLVNKGDRTLALRLMLADPSYSIVGSDRFEVDAASVASVPLTLRARTDAVHGRSDVVLAFAPPAGDAVRVTTRFFAPESP